MLLLFIELRTSFSWCLLPTNIRTLLLLDIGDFLSYDVIQGELRCGAGAQWPDGESPCHCWVSPAPPGTLWSLSSKQASLHFTLLGTDDVWWPTWLPYLLISPGIWSVVPSRSQLGSPFSWSPPSFPPGSAPTLTEALWHHELCWGFLLWSDGIFFLSFLDIFIFKKNVLG